MLQAFKIFTPASRKVPVDAVCFPVNSKAINCLTVWFVLYLRMDVLQDFMIKHVPADSGSFCAICLAANKNKSDKTASIE